MPQDSREVVRRAPPSDAVVRMPSDHFIRDLAKAVLKFQSYLFTKGGPAGLLCQAWLPLEEQDRTLRYLTTKGMPFCVAGLGDLLALFRCISCRFVFHTDPDEPATLGAPGRVFTSLQPEMAYNVQKKDPMSYHRKAEAEQCRVQATLLLPIFTSPQRSAAVAVLELVQTSEDMQFVELARLMATMLQDCQLYTCDVETVRQRMPADAMEHPMLPMQTNTLRGGARASGSDATAASESTPTAAAHVEPAAVVKQGPPQQQPPQQPQQAVAKQEQPPQPAQPAQQQRPQQQAASGPASTRATSTGASEDLGDGDSEDMDQGGKEEEEEEEEEGPSGRPQKKEQARRRGRGSGNAGKPGVRLRLEDLQPQFGLGLKEAAAQLGICPTTLKRACRRHGIQRWPRRQLQKVHRTLDEMEKKNEFVVQPPPAGSVRQAASDSRWAALANFLPSFHGPMRAHAAPGYLPGQPAVLTPPLLVALPPGAAPMPGALLPGAPATAARPPAAAGLSPPAGVVPVPMRFGAPPAPAGSGGSVSSPLGRPPAAAGPAMAAAPPSQLRGASLAPMACGSGAAAAAPSAAAGADSALEFDLALAAALAEEDDLKDDDVGMFDANMLDFLLSEDNFRLATGASVDSFRRCAE